MSTSPPPETPLAPSSRDKILDVAEVLYARRGFEGVGMREVADALDLTEGRISQLHGQAMSRLRVALTESHGNGDLFD